MSKKVASIKAIEAFKKDVKKISEKTKDNILKISSKGNAKKIK